MRLLPLDAATQTAYDLHDETLGRDVAATFGCTTDGRCPDCGNDLDTLCPILLLPAAVAVARAVTT